MSCRRGDVAIARERTDQTVREGSVSSLDHAVSTVVSPVDHLQFAAGIIAKQVEVMIDQIKLPAGFLQRHRRHGEILSPHSWVGELSLLAIQK